MTIEEAIFCMRSYIPSDTARCAECNYFQFMTADGELSYCKSAEAHKMAVEALEKLKEYIA